MKSNWRTAVNIFLYCKHEYLGSYLSLPLNYMLGTGIFLNAAGLTDVDFAAFFFGQIEENIV